MLHNEYRLRSKSRPAIGHVSSNKLLTSPSRSAELAASIDKRQERRDSVSLRIDEGDETRCFDNNTTPTLNVDQPQLISEHPENTPRVRETESDDLLHRRKEQWVQSSTVQSVPRHLRGDNLQTAVSTLTGRVDSLQLQDLGHTPPSLVRQVGPVWDGYDSDDELSSEGDQTENELDLGADAEDEYDQEGAEEEQERQRGPQCTTFPVQCGLCDDSFADVDALLVHQDNEHT